MSSAENGRQVSFWWLRGLPFEKNLLAITMTVFWCPTSHPYHKENQKPRVMI